MLGARVNGLRSDSMLDYADLKKRDAELTLTRNSANISMPTTLSLPRRRPRNYITFIPQILLSLNATVPISRSDETVTSRFTLS